MKPPYVFAADSKTNATNSNSPIELWISHFGDSSSVINVQIKNDRFDTISWSLKHILTPNHRIFKVSAFTRLSFILLGA